MARHGDGALHAVPVGVPSAAQPNPEHAGPTGPVAVWLLLGLAGAVALRVGLAGIDGARSAGAGACFGAVLLVPAIAGGWRPAHVRGRELAVGVLGGAPLCVLPFAVVVTGDLVPLDPAGFPRWAVVVTLVAVAEEVLLRGALFSALSTRSSDLTALAVTTVAFALLHVPLYGWAVVPLDLAVGVWLGGLRLATGGSAAPAAAHTVADLAGWWLR